MNNFLKLLQKINIKAFRFIKEQEYKIRGLIEHKKVEKLLAEFKENNADTLQQFQYAEYMRVPDIQSLNTFLREYFDSKYPQYVCVEQLDEEAGPVVHLFEMIYAGEELRGKYNGKDIYNFYNMQGKAFCYIRTIVPYNYFVEFQRYQEYKWIQASR